MKKQLKYGLAAICLLAAFLGIWIFFQQAPSDERETLVITMPRGELISDIETNYFKQWLEEQTGCQLTFHFMPETYGEEFLENIFFSGSTRTDIIWFGGENSEVQLTAEQLNQFGEEGYLLPLGDYIEESVYFGKIADHIQSYDLIEFLTA